MSCKNTDHLRPTFQGYCATTHDAMLIFEACRRGVLHPIPRRPKDKEKDLIRSGNIFVYSEEDTGIKRWTDGVLLRLNGNPADCSPRSALVAVPVTLIALGATKTDSYRVLSSFLVYRQLRVKYQPGERKRVVNRQQRPSSFSGPFPFLERLPRTSSSEGSVGCFSDYSMASSRANSAWMAANVDEERNLVGSLTNSYDFKQDGLVKKTLTVFIDERPYHLVSYYTVNAVKEKKLNTPSNSTLLGNIIIPKDFLAKQNFRLYTSPFTSPRSSFSDEKDLIERPPTESPYEFSTFAPQTGYSNPECESIPVTPIAMGGVAQPLSYHQYGSFPSTPLGPMSPSKVANSPYIATPPGSHGALPISMNPSSMFSGNKDNSGIGDVSLFRRTPITGTFSPAHSRHPSRSPTQPPSPALTVVEKQDPYIYPKVGIGAPTSTYTTANMANRLDNKPTFASEFQVPRMMYQNGINQPLHEGLTKEHFASLTAAYAAPPTPVPFSFSDAHGSTVYYPNAGRERGENDPHWHFSHSQGKFAGQQTAITNTTAFPEKFAPRYDYSQENTR